MARKILYLGFHHRHDDPRLFFREMRALHQGIQDAEFHFLGNSATHGDGPDEFVFRELGIELHVRLLPQPKARLKRAAGRLSRAVMEARYVRSIRPDVIQASDAREVLPALLLSRIGGASPVYDSHEDYFSQAYEYGRKTVIALIKALGLLAQEMLFLRFFSAVFCTDEFLFRRYSRRLYGVQRLHLVRNLPFAGDHPRERSSKAPADELKLVYIGGVNELRGVTESVEYIRRFNGEFAPSRRLSLTVYGQDHPILRPLRGAGEFRHYPWLEYPKLMGELENYDVGVCLLLPLKKFERNLPLKNFDYMAAGLPILTSNFGDLKRHIDLSQAGLCIDPLSYEEFEGAILQLFDPETRHRLGRNGTRFVEQRGGFLGESRSYVSLIAELTGG